MKSQGMRQIIQLSAAALLATSLMGCAGKSNHQQWVDNGNQRWHSLRPAAMLNMAENQFASGDLDLAEKTVREAAAIDADHPGLRLLAGRIALERSRLERAFRLFALSAALDETSADAFYYQGVVLQRWQRYDAALKAYQKAYELDREDPARLLAVAETMVSLNRSDQAIALLESKELYFNQNAGCRAMLGHLYAMGGQHDKAVVHFGQAVLLDGDNPRLQVELALSQVAADRPGDAAQTLKALLETPEYQSRTDLKRILAEVEVENGRLEVARQIYIELTRADPGRIADWIHLGELCWQLEDTGGALIAAGRVIKLAPARHEGYLLAGLVWQKRGQLDHALKMFDRAAELAPTRTTPLLLRGISLENADRRAAAAEAYRQALQRNPSDQRARRLLSQVATD